MFPLKNSLIIILALLWPLGAVALELEAGGEELAGERRGQGQEKQSSIPLKHAIIGVLAYRGKAEALTHWTPTATYLSKRIKTHKFEIRPLSLTEMEEAVKHSRIDFMVTNSGHYITLSSRYGGARLVTLNASKALSNENVTGSVIFARADRSDIKNLTDLRDKTFLSVAPEAFCFQTAWYALKKHNVDPFKDFKKLLFVGFPQDYIATAVKKGTVDVGNVRTGVLEAMAAEGKIKMSDFHILGPKKTPGFHYASTTKIYPEWPFVKLKHTDQALAQKVAIALLQMAPDSRAAKLGHYAGWTVPLDYSPVHDLFRALKIGPYAGLSELTFASFVSRYKSWVIGLFGLLLTSLIWAIRSERVATRRTAELAKANENLAQQISHRTRAEETALTRQIALEHMSRQNALGEMASAMAHDLNHPLATILNYVKGCSRKLETQSCDPEEIKSIIQHVSLQAQHAADVINFMVNFVRKESKPRETADVNEIIREMSELLKPEISRKGIVLELRLAPKLPAVLVDIVQIDQLILNLIRNAVNAMKQSDDRKARLTVITRATDNDQVEISVQDTGSGIPLEIRNSVFEPFTTRSSTTTGTTDNPGLGLGLSICRSVVEKHGGHIWIHSTSSIGTDVRVALPQMSQAASPDSA